MKVCYSNKYCLWVEHMLVRKSISAETTTWAFGNFALWRTVYNQLREDFHFTSFCLFFLFLWLTVVHLSVWKVLNQGQILQSDEQILVVFLFPSQFLLGWDGYCDHSPVSKSGFQVSIFVFDQDVCGFLLPCFRFVPWHHQSYSIIFLTQFHSNFSLVILLVISFYHTFL